MSQQEFDQPDAQVIGMVENHAHPDAKKAAEKICSICADTQAAELRREILLTTIQILSCILVAALFVATLIDPAIIVFLVNAGVLVCGMVAAVKLDRAIRSWRKR